MNAKLDFLRTVSPFNLLPEEVLEGTAELLQEVRYKKEEIIYQQEITKMKGLDIIVEGEYESFFFDSTHNKRLVEHHGPGYCFGGMSVLLNRKRALKTVIVKKRTLVYFLPRKDFRALCQAFDDFFHFFTKDFGKRMVNDEFAHFFKNSSASEESYIASDQLYSRRISDVEYREVVSCSADTPIFEAAQTMATTKTGCLFVTDEQGKIIGYVTDITLRDNVIAKLADARNPVISVMDNPVVSIKRDSYAYEAILMMFNTNSRYLLIEDNDQYYGFISRNKLLSEQAQSPLVFIQSVKQARSVNELKKKWETVPQIITQLLGRGVHSQIVNQVITTVADTIALKVIEQVIAEMGKPPAKFVFMVLGSEGRKEQTLKTDQDNAIIYEDKANEHRELVRDYFLKFADSVSTKLDFTGFKFCTGGFMAKNPQWTHSLSHWKRNYESWMEESLPEAVIKFSTFFDCRYIYGDKTIMDELHTFLDDELQKPLDKLFFHMTNNALQYEAPLTFFKNIRTFAVGSQEAFDIKKAMTPIVDLVRVYALKNRIFEVNTGERLKALKAANIFSELEYHELMQSYYFLMGMRLRKQASQIIQDRVEPDNYIYADNLTKIEQVTLIEIFKTIEKFQSRIRLSFTNSLFG